MVIAMLYEVRIIKNVLNNVVEMKEIINNYNKFLKYSNAIGIA